MNAETIAELDLLRERLRSEGADDLVQKLAICQKPLVLKCLTCGTRKQVAQRCKRKWCPCCAKLLAAARSTELEFIVERMRWPLFVTLTMKNESDLSSGGVRKLRRAFGKLRHRKLWKSCTRGGVAAVEVTNIGNGWHPHLHAVIDCKWLAWKTPAPQRRDPVEKQRLLYQLAAQELERAWAKCLGQSTASVKVKRANKSTITKEVVKYTVKNEDLVLCEGRASDLIRALETTRLLTTFGTAHGQTVKDIRLQARAAAKAKNADWQASMQQFDCCPAVDLWPESTPISDATDARIQARRRHAHELQCKPA